MKFKYNNEKDIIIKKHEEKMLEVYSDIINSYSLRFIEYGCLLKLGMHWSKNFNEKYSFSICCRALKEGKEEILIDDGYLLLYASWNVSIITKQNDVYLIEDTSEAFEDMEIFLKNVEENLEKIIFDKGECRF